MAIHGQIREFGPRLAKGFRLAKFDERLAMGDDFIGDILKRRKALYESAGR